MVRSSKAGELLNQRVVEGRTSIGVNSDQYENVLVAFVIHLEWSNVIQMDHFEGVIESACKWVRLDRDAQTIHHLTARALPNELCVVDRRYDIEDLGGNME